MYTARILERLCAACPFLLDNIDLVAGSSTGGLIAILLGMGYSPRSIVEFYRKSSGRIFARSLMRSHNPFMARWV